MTTIQQPQVDHELVEKVRRELFAIQSEMRRAAIMEKHHHKREVAKNMKPDRHAVTSFTRQQIRFAEQLLGIN